MSEIAVTLIKVLFLALLWVFIGSAVSVIRSDLFGKPVTATQTGPQQALDQAAPVPRKARKIKGTPRVFSVTNGSMVGTKASLDGGVVMIGRGSDCELMLTGDDYISTRHARVVRANDDSWYVEDLGSANGTYVNGQRITAPTTITLQDSVRIGKTVLKLET